jgi:hypothetical protein
MGLEPVDLDGLGIKLESLLLVSQELLDILSLVSLQLNHLAHLSVRDDGAIASELLLDDLENLLLVEFLGQTLNSGQSLTSITLLNTYMDVILRLLGFSGVFVGFGEGVCRQGRRVSKRKRGGVWFGRAMPIMACDALVQMQVRMHQVDGGGAGASEQKQKGAGVP